MSKFIDLGLTGQLLPREMNVLDSVGPWPKMGIGEVIAIFWTINNPPGLQGLSITNTTIYTKIILKFVFISCVKGVIFSVIIQMFIFKYSISE